MDKLNEFIKELIIYDYILFGGLLLLFLLFITIGILLRHIKILALLLVLVAFIMLIFGSIFGYIEMHKYLFKNEVTLNSQQKLSFTEAVVVYATLKNSSLRDFKSCKVSATVYRVSGNKIKDYIRKLKPIAKMSIIEDNIAIGQEREIKIIIDQFTYGGDYNVSLGADCR
jgi:glucan phosphoethanolaminetransferase (alkaline phosphatase superfamily)